VAEHRGRRTLTIYAEASGKRPFTDWIQSLRDAGVRNRIRARLDRVEEGNLGDCRSVGDGVRELRMFFGPGYRVYFGEDGADIVVCSVVVTREASTGMWRLPSATGSTTGGGGHEAFG